MEPLILEAAERVAPDVLHCRARRGTVLIEFTMRAVRHGEIELLKLEGLSDEEYDELDRHDEHRSLMRTLSGIRSGVESELPLRIISDWPRSPPA
jgi:hypothetical protein